MYVIIVGCGSVGARLAKTMSAEEHDVVVIDRRADAFGKLGSGFNGLTVTGTGVDEDVLRKAGIERADGLAAVTSNDSTNIMVAQIAQALYQVPRVVARVFDPDKEFAYKEFGLETVSPTIVGVAQIRNALIASRFNRRLSVGSDVEVIQLTANGPLTGRHVSDINVSGQVRCVAVTRGRCSLLADDELILADGDQLLVAVKVDAIEGFRKTYVSQTKEPTGRTREEGP
jgi:trk system potassium uptake protein TrkA